MTNLKSKPRVGNTESSSEGRDSYYGYGWMVSKDGVFSHYGSDGTNAWVDPKNDLIVLVFTQSLGEGKMHTRFLKLVQVSILE